MKWWRRLRNRFRRRRIVFGFDMASGDDRCVVAVARYERDGTMTLLSVKEVPLR